MQSTNPTIEELIGYEHPLRIHNPSNEVQVFVVDEDDQVPAAFLAMTVANCIHKVGMRIGGGCSEMSVLDKMTMMRFFQIAYWGYKGSLFTGATRELDSNGKLSLMVTEIAGMVANENSGAFAAGTLPKTYGMRLRGESIMNVSKYGAILNPLQEAILLVQPNPSEDFTGPEAWAGDVKMYIKCMRHWLDHARFERVGLVLWNGGVVTEIEFKLVANLGWNVYVVTGTGRAADKIATQPEFAEYRTMPNVFIVSKDDPVVLRNLFVQHGFIRA